MDRCIKDKMKFFYISVICAVTQISYQNPLSRHTLLPNILVVEVSGALGHENLSCLDSAEELRRRDDEGQAIYWKMNGVDKPQRGNSYLVRLDESLGGGNYTCHDQDGTLLNYTVVLIQEDKTKRRKILVKTDQKDYLECSAQNYNGDFHCSWTWHKSRVGKVTFIRVQRVSDDDDVQCSVGTSVWTCSSGQSNFSCSVDDSGHGISCLDKQHCPYAEERQKIHITVYLRTESRFLMETYSKIFYLSEIVKPDKVHISKVNTTTIRWTYPSSWSSPYSYFPLTFQIMQLRGKCKRCDNPCIESKVIKKLTVQSTDICHVEVKHKAKSVCVRAKDAFCDSQWSEWSYLRLRKKHQPKRN